MDVIIPLKDRRTVVPCVTQLLTLGRWIETIWLCDGGSADGEVLAGLTHLQQYPQVKLLPGAIAGFNKATLLNRGIAHADADILLLSDADILWNQAALEALYSAICHQSQCIAYVRQVWESNPQTPALHRPRYGYRLDRAAVPMAIAIEALPMPPQSQRPGCGLICARRATLQYLGGYKTCFQGWGWEDQDLLMRAELLGVAIVSAGEVTHLSHSDGCRNQFHPQTPLGQSRDRNILMGLRQLQLGQWQGALSIAPAPSAPLALNIMLPDALISDANKTYPSFPRRRESR